jgi:hypothetical protein
MEHPSPLNSVLCDLCYICVQCYVQANTVMVGGSCLKIGYDLFASCPVVIHKYITEFQR